jgi:predicted CXXCH cytochrome family protein
VITAPAPRGVTTPDERSDPPWVDGRCGGCHQIEDAFTHPVGIVPSMPVPPGLPLEHGRLECTTCHDNRASADHLRARELHTPLLRLEAADLCAECHDRTSTSHPDVHAMMLDRAHLRWPGVGAEPGGSGPPASPDAASGTCLGCHDGSVASAAIDRPPLPRLASGALRSVSIGASHPVGTEYRLHGGVSLRPTSALDPRIRLFDNRIGCGSCHSPYAGGEAMLVMSNLGSRLCLSCHDF